VLLDLQVLILTEILLVSSGLLVVEEVEFIGVPTVLRVERVMILQWVLMLVVEMLLPLQLQVVLLLLLLMLNLEGLILVGVVELVQDSLMELVEHL
jgi:hypothetical protein